MNDCIIRLEEAREIIRRVLDGMGVPEEDIEVVADSLMDAEQSGVESHGLMRLPAYAERLAKGCINSRPDIRIMISGAVAKIDGNNGLGQVITAKAVDTALFLAKEHGVGIVSVSHSNHFGTGAFYSKQLAKAGCIGLVASLAGPTVAPFGGREMMLGTNPFSISFPGKENCFCSDMATSAVAKGKIRVYASGGRQIPIGWALDKDGNDTTDPQKAIEGILLPMAGHKGYALAMVVDAVCGLLSGAALSCESASMFSDKPANTGHFVMAIDIAHFLPLEEFEQRAQDWFDRIHKSRTREGVERVLIPGEPEEKQKLLAGEEMKVRKKTLEKLSLCLEKYGKK